MGSQGDKQRKPHRHLDKVPKYEERNSLTGYTRGTAGFGREGHGVNHGKHEKPGKVGTWFLRVLGMKPKD